MKEYKNLKKGDIIVQVRKGYQNYDHTVIPCEPKVYTFKSKSATSGVWLEENISHTWLGKDGTRYASSMGFDQSFLYRDFEMLETYIIGEYNKDIILDTERWKSLEEFLRFKMENDYELAKEKDDKKRKKEDAEFKKKRA
jgi:hypothetical protein